MQTTWFRREKDVTILTLYVQPGAMRNEMAGLHGEALKIKLAAPPVEGRANDTLLRYIADLFSVAHRNVELRQGTRSRRKVVAIRGSNVSPDDLLSRKTTR
jgi:uncharacterized protein (TIGR00251 family)